MNVIFEKTYPRSINVLIERFSKPEMRGAKLEAWLFDDQPSRYAAETRLREAASMHICALPISRFCISSLKKWRVPQLKQHQFAIHATTIA